MITLSKFMLIVGILAAQTSLLNAGMPPDNKGFTEVAVLVGTGIFGAGVAAGLGLAKTIQVARGPQGTPKTVAQGTLITAGLIALVTIGYGAAKLK